MDATAMLDRAEHDAEALHDFREAFVPERAKAEMAYRKPAVEQYPQRNRAERRMAAKLARRERAKVG